MMNTRVKNAIANASKTSIETTENEKMTTIYSDINKILEKLIIVEIKLKYFFRLLFFSHSFLFSINLT